MLEQKDLEIFPQTVVVACDNTTGRFVGWLDKPVEPTAIYLACWEDMESVSTQHKDVTLVEMSRDQAMVTVREQRRNPDHESGVPRVGLVLLPNCLYLAVD